MTQHSANRLQRNRILELLLRARGDWVPLPELISIAAQYNARIFELKHKLGFNIENRVEWCDGTKPSWFRLVPGPSLPASAPTANQSCPPSESGSLFGDLSQEVYPD